MHRLNKGLRYLQSLCCSQSAADNSLASLLMLVSMETCSKATLLAAVHLLSGYNQCNVIWRSAEPSKLLPLPRFYIILAALTLSDPPGPLSQTAHWLITGMISQRAQKNCKNGMDVHIVWDFISYPVLHSHDKNTLSVDLYPVNIKRQRTQCKRTVWTGKHTDGVKK